MGGGEGGGRCGLMGMSEKIDYETSDMLDCTETHHGWLPLL